MRPLLSLLAAATLLAGCGGGGSAAASAETVTVFAAASLREAFAEVGKSFEAAHPGARVRFNFGPSSGLAEQIVQRAPADAFAAANTSTMDKVVDAGLTDGVPAVFARNYLEIAVPPGNPAGVRGLADFAKPELKLALCAEQVPCGSAANKAFAAASVTPRPDTLEQDVKAVLAKVRLGEVDAGIVYRTDVRAAGDKVVGIDFPEAEQAVNDYPIVALKDAANAAAARAFVEYVRGGVGVRLLTAAGFAQP
jgi:molybdate transport system substrate-binding protein